MSKQFQNEQALKVLKKTFSIPQARILIENKKQPQKWSEGDIAEGLVLRSFSRKAYNFLRDKKKIPLPSESALRSWVRSFKCDPGLQIDSMNILKSKLLTEEDSSFA
ncbi:MAG: hypothetical protein FJ333_11315, partial [Sphingomonadales bacterium]|nr:hypothetical protein [Sphingomonadales bacterium]